MSEYVKVLKVKVKKLSSEAKMPEYQNSGDSGCDAHACLNELQHYNKQMIIEPGLTALVPTGLSFDIPYGYECQVRSRSGLAIKRGVHVLNSPGTVDASYKGEVGVILHNTSNFPFVVNHGDRIAQFVFVPVNVAMFEETETLSESTRGSGGFGSTGV
jgi:dUTP pyrophosphatase